MTHPLLAAIDAALVDSPADGVQAIAEGLVLSDLQDELGLDLTSRAPVQYRGVTISRSLAQIEAGWAVRIKPVQIEDPSATAQLDPPV